LRKSSILEEILAHIEDAPGIGVGVAEHQPGAVLYPNLPNSAKKVSYINVSVAIIALAGSYPDCLLQVIDYESKRFVDAIFVPK
jgi:hypothetical protein